MHNSGGVINIEEYAEYCLKKKGRFIDKIMVVWLSCTLKCVIYSSPFGFKMQNYMMAHFLHFYRIIFIKHVIWYKSYDKNDIQTHTHKEVNMVLISETVISNLILHTICTQLVINDKQMNTNYIYIYLTKQ